MSSEFIYCMECGTRLPALAKFCNVCGTRVLTGDQAEPSTVVTPPVESSYEPDTTVVASELEETAETENYVPGGPAEMPGDETLVAPTPLETPPVSGERPDPFRTQIAELNAVDSSPTGEEEEADEPAPPTAAPAAVWPSEPAEGATTEVRHYPPRQEIRREDLPSALQQEERADTREFERPQYDEARGGFSLRPGMIMAAVGFAVALAGVFLPWVSTGGEEIAPLDDEFLSEAFQYFQISDALDSEETLDGYVVIGVAAVGLLFLLVEYLVLRRLPVGRVFAALGGLGLGALGVVELLWIRDALEDVSYDYEPGLFLVIIGGATAIVGSLIPVGFGDDG